MRKLAAIVIWTYVNDSINKLRDTETFVHFILAPLR